MVEKAEAKSILSNQETKPSQLKVNKSENKHDLAKNRDVPYHA